ncbi:MAG: efflux RND transporter periplasmic adaptor subunit [bacterium]|nr:efflux RND transporter periplasmic adaptor subunit [bacterium]
MNDQQNLSPRYRRSTWRRRLWRWTQLLVVLGAAAGVGYWMFLKSIPVREHLVTCGEIVAEVMGTGTLEARRQAVISPEISGRIVEVHVDQGDRVESGQELLQLDDENLRRQVEVSESNLAAARAGVERQNADRLRAQAVLDQASIDYIRVKDLTAQNAASSLELDKATEALRVAEADFSRTEAALVEAEKQVIAAEKTLEYHRARLADTVVTAPFDGLIVRRDRDPGDVIVPGSSVLLLVSTDELWISAWVDETEMDRLSPGQPARVVFRSQPGESFAGEVARLGREADRETREFLVDVWVHKLPTNWAVGQRAEAYIEVARKPDVTLLPAHMVSRREGKPGVFAALNGKAKWQNIKLGLRGRKDVEVAEGLATGDAIIFVYGPKTPPIAPGTRVTIP